MLGEAVEFLKEYGDVLGAIGTLSAFTMLLITNGRVILQRLRGHKPVSLQAQIFGGKTAIAILPVTVQDPSTADTSSAFACSLEDELHTDLSAAGFAAPAPDLTRQAQSVANNGTELTKKLGATYALETSLRSQDEKCRITARLTDNQGAVVWSQRLDCSATDAIKAPEDMACEIIKGVSDALTADQANPVAPEARENAVTREGLGGSVTSADAIPTIDLGGLDAPIVTSPKSRFIAFMLCFFVVGLFGAHRFYVGRPLTGILYICTAGLLTFGWFFDLVLIALGMFADGKGRPVRNFHPHRAMLSV